MGFAHGVGYIFAAFSAKIFAALVVVDGAGIKDYSYGWYFIAFCVFLGIVAASQIRPKKYIVIADQPSVVSV